MTDHGQGVIRAGEPDAGEESGRGLLVVSRVADAVSYTHLRAHETVLDLVCRLLLEKNTPNSQRRTRG